MLNADVLTFQEFVAHETLPLSQIHGAVLEFLQGRKDVALLGAHALNAYVSEPRMTQDVDLLSTNPKEFAEELTEHLSETFKIAVCVREVAQGKGYRFYQKCKEGNRHLVDVRFVAQFPNTEQIENINVLAPTELIVSKMISFQSRYGNPKSFTDRRDLAVLLLRFPELKEKVTETLQSKNVGDAVLKMWSEIEAQDLRDQDSDDDLSF